jgi:uncharacterized protein (TIGR03083 family)
MSAAPADPLIALRVECEAVSRTVRPLAEEEFPKRTRLPAWNVKELLGHMYRDVDRTNVALGQPPPGAADTDSISYWRRYDPAVDGPDIADRAKELAATFDSGRELVQAWDRMWPLAVDAAAAADRRRVVVTWGPALTLAEFLRTRVLEVTVHRLDLHDALGLAPQPTDEGLGITAEILRGLMGGRLPPGLWNAVTFVEKGTGRVDLTDGDRVALGRLAESFPLLQ